MKHISSWFIEKCALKLFVLFNLNNVCFSQSNDSIKVVSNFGKAVTFTNSGN